MATPRPGVFAGGAAARTRALLATAHRLDRIDEIPRLERQLQVDIAADYIEELVAGAPPLTDEQITGLRRILSGGA